MALNYLKDSDKKTVVGPIRPTMLTRGTRISKEVDDFFAGEKIALNYKTETIICRITQDKKGARTIQWYNTSIVESLIKFKQSKNISDMQLEEYTVNIQKTGNLYNIFFSFDNMPELSNRCGGFLDEYERHRFFNPTNLEDARKFINIAIALRRGQRKFRQDIISAYSGKCAVTGCDTEDSLEAAHINPFKGDHTNFIENGLLLRADIHTLFDLKKLAIDSNYIIQLHPSLRDGYYKDLHGKPLENIPKTVTKWPSKEALAQHRTEADF